MTLDLYTCDLDTVTMSNLREFVENTIAARAQAESLVLEFKSKRDGGNVNEAVAGFANTDGGLVLLGVDDRHDDPLVGVPWKEVDQLAQSLRKLPTDAMPEVIPIRLTESSDKVVIVLRVNTENVETPVILDGRVLVRIPGHTVGADRSQILALFNRTTGGQSGGSSIRVDPARIDMWSAASEFALEVRAGASVVLPRRSSQRMWLGTEACDAIEARINELQVPDSVLAGHARPDELDQVAWHPTERAAMRLRMRSSRRRSPYRGSPHIDMSLLISMSGRQLDVVAATGISGRSDAERPFAGAGPEELHEMLLGTSVVAQEALVAAVVAMDLAAPLSHRTMAASVSGSDGLGLLNFSGGWSTVEEVSRQTDWLWPDVSVDSFGPASVRSVVDRWMTQLLFDLGATGFEGDLDSWNPGFFDRPAQ